MLIQSEFWEQGPMNADKSPQKNKKTHPFSYVSAKKGGSDRPAQLRVRPREAVLNAQAGRNRSLA